MVSSKFRHRAKTRGTPKICRPSPPPPPTGPWPPDPITGSIQAVWDCQQNGGHDENRDYSAIGEPYPEEFHDHCQDTPPGPYDVEIRFDEETQSLNLSFGVEAPDECTASCERNEFPIQWGVHNTYICTDWDQTMPEGTYTMVIKL